MYGITIKPKLKTMKKYIAFLILAFLFSCKKDETKPTLSSQVAPNESTLEITVNSNKIHPYLRVVHNGLDIVEYNKGSNVYTKPAIITFNYSVKDTGTYEIYVVAGKSSVDSTFDIRTSDQGAIWSSLTIKKNGNFIYDKKITLNIAGNPGASQHIVKVPF